MEIMSASQKDKEQLMSFFKHYSNPEILERRIDCYLTHNQTLLAKDGDRIVGTLQWQVKEDPNCGVAEFEEFHILEEFRGEGIGSSLIEYGIRSVKDFFQKHGIEPRRIFAFVGKERESARRTYEKHGFRQMPEVGYLFSESEVDLLYSMEF